MAGTALFFVLFGSMMPFHGIERLSVATLYPVLVVLELPAQVVELAEVLAG